MEGYIELFFDNKVSHYIKIEHISCIENRNGSALISMLNGNDIETFRDFNDIIKQIKEHSKTIKHQ